MKGPATGRTFVALALSADAPGRPRGTPSVGIVSLANVCRWLGLMLDSIGVLKALRFTTTPLGGFPICIHRLSTVTIAPSFRAIQDEGRCWR